MVERYGSDSPINVPQLRAKINNTMIKRYGVPWAMMSTTVQNKNISTHQLKWDGPYSTKHFTEDAKMIFKTPELLKKELQEYGFGMFRYLYMKKYGSRLNTCRSNTGDTIWLPPHF